MNSINIHTHIYTIEWIDTDADVMLRGVMEPSKKEPEVMVMADWNDSLTKKKKASPSYVVILSFSVTVTPCDGMYVRALVLLLLQLFRFG